MSSVASMRSVSEAYLTSACQCRPGATLLQRSTLSRSRRRVGNARQCYPSCVQLEAVQRCHSRPRRAAAPPAPRFGVVSNAHAEQVSCLSTLASPRCPNSMWRIAFTS